MADSTTSSHMGPNVRQFAIYPVRVRVRTLTGEVHDFGVIFLSRDLLHDKYQVEQMEARLMDLVEEEFGFRPTGLQRMSDQCSSQFRSRFTVWQLQQAPTNLGLAPGGRVAHHYFETGHGKSESDAYGAIAKGAWTRGVARATWEEGPTTMEEVAELMRSNLPGHAMKSADFIKIEVTPPLTRPSKDDAGQIPVKGISKLHSLVRTPDGRILGSRLTCKECLRQTEVCPKCEALEPLYVPGEELEVGDQEEEVEGAEVVPGIDDDGELSGAEEDEADAGEVEGEGAGEEEEDSFPPGTIVWARVRSWQPGQVVGLLDLPQEAQRQLGRNTSGRVVVRRFHLGDLKVIQPGRLEPLAENRVDKYRAAVSDEIGIAYDLALATMHGDI